MIPPHDLDAERSVLGGMLTSDEVTSSAAKILRLEDFYSKPHGSLFAVLVDEWQHGRHGDTKRLAALLDKTGDLETLGGPAGLVSLMAGGVMRSTIGRVAAVICGHSTRRRLIAAAEEIQTSALDITVDPVEALDIAKSRLIRIDVPATSTPKDLYNLDEFLDRPEAQRPPWVIPGLLRSGWRALVVAPEGIGKSMLFRQFAIASAQGLHPFGFTPARRIRTLIVDLENPEDILRDKATPIRDHARRSSADYDGANAFLWHRPQGINLRTRSDVAEFEACLAAVRPELVCMGPLYKAYRVAVRENDELATAECQQALDDLRARYGFALLLEHHAPKKQGGVRELVPYGSSLWLRWPEFGLKLLPMDDTGNSLSVEHWRGSRTESAWPKAIHRGNNWPWVGEWDNADWKVTS